MAHVTKISAGKSGKPKDSEKAKNSKKPESKAEKAIEKYETPVAVAVPASKLKENKNAAKKYEKTRKKELRKAKRAEKRKNEKPFVTAFKMPFRAIGRYVKESWFEIRACHWPNRKATWSMVFAVFIYTAIFMIFITLLDMLFTFVFNLILK